MFLPGVVMPNSMENDLSIEFVISIVVGVYPMYFNAIMAKEPSIHQQLHDRLCNASPRVSAEY